MGKVVRLAWPSFCNRGINFRWASAGWNGLQRSRACESSLSERGKLLRNIEPGAPTPGDLSWNYHALRKPFPSSTCMGSGGSLGVCHFVPRRLVWMFRSFLGLLLTCGRPVQAYVTLEGVSMDILIDGLTSQNRAVPLSPFPDVASHAIQCT